MSSSLRQDFRKPQKRAQFMKNIQESKKKRLCCKTYLVKIMTHTLNRSYIRNGKLAIGCLFYFKLILT